MPLIARYLKARILSRSVFISVFLFFILYGSYIFFFSHYSSKQQSPLISKKALTDIKVNRSEQPVKFEKIALKTTNEDILSEATKKTDSFNTGDSDEQAVLQAIKMDELHLKMLTSTGDSDEQSVLQAIKKDELHLKKMLTSTAFDSREYLSDESVLFYNRVPKCGSSAFVALLTKLGKKNGFLHWSSKHFWKRLVPEAEQKLFLRTIMKKEKPCSVDRHIYFINCTGLGYDNFYYVNLIRDPVERIISDFHYLRAPKRWKVSTSPIPPQSWFKKNFSECVLKNDPECSFNSNSYVDLPIAYFCGHNKECKKLNSKWALQKAKSNVEKYYTVVGISEDFETMVQIAEKLLPTFFKGALEIFHKEEFKMNKTPKKPRVSKKVRNILKNKLKLEYEFYNFIKQRIANQKKSLSL